MFIRSRPALRYEMPPALRVRGCMRVILRLTVISRSVWTGGEHPRRRAPPGVNAFTARSGSSISGIRGWRRRRFYYGLLWIVAGLPFGAGVEADRRRLI